MLFQFVQILTLEFIQNILSLFFLSFFFVRLLFNNVNFIEDSMGSFIGSCGFNRFRRIALIITS